MPYFQSNDPYFLFKVIDCYYKKEYLKKPNDDLLKQAKDFMGWFDKEIYKNNK